MKIRATYKRLAQCKSYLLIKVLLFIIANFLLSQNILCQSRLDTFSIFYPIPTYDTANDEPNHFYYSNGKRVDQKTGKANLLAAEVINKCTPCILKIYGPNGILSEGMKYGDGKIGYWIEYYPKSGRRKVIGQYKYYSPAEIGECCKQVGKWKYYNPQGKLTRIETFAN